VTEANWLPSFIEARAWGFLDGLTYAVVVSAFSAFGGRLSRAAEVASFALRTRMVAGILVIFLVAIAAYIVGLSPGWIMFSFGISNIIFVYFALSGIYRLGISNAFSTTTKGISAERSLKMVKTDFSFLGIGANKLTSSDEFRKALLRCKKEGGSVRFLLSDPDNKGLLELAGQNNKDNLAYKTRVRQSIREIHYQCKSTGVSCDIRLYSLENEKSLSKFRMMFVNSSICLLSHVVWNEAEGGDNSQLVLTRLSNRGESGLYHAYLDFFEDLWSSATVKKLTEDDLEDGFGG